METRYDWHIRAQNSIAHAALTNSKRPESLVKGIFPTHLSSGRGCRVTDAYGKTFVDFICGLGSSILGYGNDEVGHAISHRAHLGASLSLGTTLEVEVAEKVKELFPFIDLVRFLKTGSDACSAALRIARTYTSKRLVLSEGYHGWADEFVSLSAPALGVHKCQDIQKLHSLNQINSTVAAVIVEPVMTDISSKRIRWLRDLRETCTKNGVLLIFDEVITGFRTPGYSMTRYLGVEPDLICLGKAMGNGMPISVVGGKKHIMDCGEWFISSTFAGETLSLAAALKTMTLLQTKYDLKVLWERGQKFLDHFNSIWPEGLTIEGYPTRGTLKGEPLIKAMFMQEACLAGILFGPSFFFNFSHLDVTDSVLSTSRDILLKIKFGSTKLLGELPKSPFAQKVRES